jgi:hypothetical protein
MVENFGVVGALKKDAPGKRKEYDKACRLNK